MWRWLMLILSACFLTQPIHAKKWEYMIPEEDVRAQEERMKKISQRARNMPDEEREKKNKIKTAEDYQKSLDELIFIRLRLPDDETVVFLGVLVLFAILALNYRLSHAWGRLICMLVAAGLSGIYSAPLVFSSFIIMSILPPRMAAWTNFALAWALLYPTCYTDSFWPVIGLDEITYVAKAMGFFVTLRVIAYSFDCADGEATAVHSNFLDYMEYCYALPGLCTGPFYPYWFFRQSMQRRAPIFWRRDVLPRLGCALLCALLYTAAVSCVPVAILWTEDFRTAPWWQQTLFVALVFQAMRFKCILVWLVSEIAIIFSGMVPAVSYEDPCHEYWGKNVVFLTYTSGSFHTQIFNWNKSLIGFFHVYVYQRLLLKLPEWMTISIVLGLMTFWHGCELGHFMAFATWSWTLLCEISLLHVVHSVVQVHNVPSLVKFFQFIFGALHSNFLLGYGFIPYLIPHAPELVFKTWSSTYFFGHFYLVSVLAVLMVLLSPTFVYRMFKDRRATKYTVPVEKASHQQSSDNDEKDDENKSEQVGAQESTEKMEDEDVTAVPTQQETPEDDSLRQRVTTSASD